MYIRFTPEINTVAIQLPINKIDCPRSGWSIKRIITEDKRKKLKKYLTWEFWNLPSDSIWTVAKIKKGFSGSIGCNLKKLKSNHLLAPFTSTPIIGTKINNKKNKENRGIASLLSKDVSIAEIKNIIHKAKNVNIRCFEKKK